MRFQVCPALFAPKDVARITGLTPTMQRDWRRNGYLPEREGGWSSFTLRDVAGIALRKTLADVPLGPAFANPVFAHAFAARVVDSIVWWALEADSESWANGESGGADDHLRSEIAKWIDDDRFGFISQVADIALADRGRVLILLPGIEKILLEMEEFRADDDAPVAVSINIYLDFIGRQIARSAGRPLVTIEPVEGDAIRFSEGVV